MGLTTCVNPLLLDKMHIVMCTIQYKAGILLSPRLTAFIETSVFPNHYVGGVYSCEPGNVHSLVCASIFHVNNALTISNRFKLDLGS